MVKTTPFLIRNLTGNKDNAKQDIIDCNRFLSVMKELHFYQSLFKTHCNSAVFNLYSKTINGEKVWIDPIMEHGKLHLLDKDEEVEEWLKPVKFER